MNRYQNNLRKEQRRRGIPSNTVITEDNYQILLTQESIIEITNRISEIIRRKVIVSEVDQLVDFIGQYPQSKICKLQYYEALSHLAKAFLQKQKISEDLRKYNEDLSVKNLTHLDVLSEEPEISEYQKKEIMQLTSDENQYKLSTFADRRGNAVVDRERVDNNRSSPNSLPSGYDNSLNNEMLMSATFKTLKTVDSFLDADSVENMFKRFNQIWTTFYNINLPHQTVQLDSRNRLLTNNVPSEYKWNIHAAGIPGHLGDVRIQDTLKEVIQMKIDPFWIPALGSVGGYYQKVRLLIKEFISQSIQVTEFLDSSQREPTSEYYHWEFDVAKISGNRIFLVPDNSTFVFRKPFARVETITFIWRIPYELMAIAPDRGVYTITYANPTIFTLTSATNNFLETGDLVYVINSNSGDADIDDELTRQEGYIITKISNTQFSIPVDTTALVGSQIGVNVYYGSKRIFTQIEFTSLEQ